MQIVCFFFFLTLGLNSEFPETSTGVTMKIHFKRFYVCFFIHSTTIYAPVRSQMLFSRLILGPRT